jgi:hypothetical protein
MKTQITIGLCAATLLIIAVVGGHYGIAQTPTPQPTPNYPSTRVTGWAFAVRTGGEATFTDKTKKIGVELVKDNVNGNFIYISETGSIAVVPAK